MSQVTLGVLISNGPGLQVSAPAVLPNILHKHCYGYDPLGLLSTSHTSGSASPIWYRDRIPKRTLLITILHYAKNQ